MSWISPDNTLTLWAFVMSAAAAAIYLEQNCRLFRKIPGAVIALLIALLFSNLGIIPLDSPVYDTVWGYVVPLAIPLLLFQLDLNAIIKESGRLLLLFLLSSVGTMIGAVIGFTLLKNHIPELDKISGIITASYTGGGVNFAAMTAKLNPSQDMTASTIVADNLMMAVYFLILISLAASSAAKRIWHTLPQHRDNDAEHSAADYWTAKPISLQNIAVSLAASIILVAVSFGLSAYLKTLIGTSGHILTDMLTGFVTDKYLLLTTLTLAFVLLSGKKKHFANGSQELGTYCIYLFFVVIGIPASIPLIIQNAPLLFVFTLIVAMTNLLLTLGLGKLFKFSLEEILLACNANIGGPTTAAALAISQGWKTLVGPILIIGTIGYIVGNYLGTIIFTLIQMLP
ncbi:DUF819 family protein [Neisseria animalis]|uniref:DUF819 domain-containing protein n=1 Tax=Neisseria animalis TaxID=492 RepID=A0A5P3MSH3_NEIAN|nr:DUF819 family protein [Neisseria animalis]QEY24553.1 DUF819 domain-containing protein [Neisseria animalis]ROW33031.1 DUF819 domain-containing protein [Neisseria animalis]VEE07347.1 Predicted integral membrane protein [Neisseria animalis]